MNIRDFSKSILSLKQLPFGKSNSIQKQLQNYTQYYIQVMADMHFGDPTDNQVWTSKA